MSTLKTQTRRMMRKADILDMVASIESKLTILEQVAEQHVTVEDLTEDLPLAFNLMRWEAQLDAARTTLLSVLSGQELDILTRDPHELFNGERT